MSTPSGTDDLPQQIDQLRDALATCPSPAAAQTATLALLAPPTNQPSAERRSALIAIAARLAQSEPDWVATVGVLANSIALAGNPAPADFVTATALAEQLGTQQVAATRATVDEVLGTGSHLPIATSVYASLSDEQQITGSLANSGMDPSAARDIARRCVASAFHLALADVAPSVGTRPASAEEFLEKWDQADLNGRRELLSTVAAFPWAPLTKGIVGLAGTRNRPLLAQQLEHAITMFRRRSEEAERRAVADELKRLVTLTGLSQRDFAEMIGTSGSRFSTWVNGHVVPATTTVVRIRRTAATLARQRSREAEIPWGW